MRLRYPTLLLALMLTACSPSKESRLKDIDDALVRNDAQQREVIADAYQRRANAQAEQIRLGFDPRAAKSADEAYQAVASILNSTERQMLDDLRQGRQKLLEKRRTLTP